MRAGHAVETIVIPDGTPMGGYADRTGGAAGTLDPLELHVVWLEDGTRTVALVVADLVCANTDLVAAVRSRLRELGAEDVLVTATHTHAGPETGCVPGGSPTPEEWLARIPDLAQAAAEKARTAVLPQTLHATLHRVMVTGVGGVRADETQPPVVPVDTLVLRDRDGVTGLLVVVPVHPTVLPAENRAVSADLTGAVRRALHGRLPDIWTVVATGAAGDISTRNTRHDQSAAECDRLGAMVADAVLAAIAGTGRTAWHSGDGIGGTATAGIALAPRPTDDPSLRHVTPGSVGNRNDRTLRQGLRIAQERVHRPAEPLRADVPVWRLGALTLVGIPGEPYLALAEQLIWNLDGPALVLGYANGYLGYLPTRDAYECPTYEVLATPAARGSGEALIEAALAAAAAQTPEIRPPHRKEQP